MDRIGSIRDFIINNFLFGDTSKLLSNNTSFLNNGIIDSTGMLEVINFVEETFGIKIEDNELLPENLDSLSNLDKFISAKFDK